MFWSVSADFGLVPGIQRVQAKASHKNGPAVVGGTVALDGTIIRDGDLVIADEDGVVIWPKEHIHDLLARAQAKLQEDNARLAQLQEGEECR